MDYFYKCKREIPHFEHQVHHPDVDYEKLYNKVMNQSLMILELDLSALEDPKQVFILSVELIEGIKGVKDKLDLEESVEEADFIFKDDEATFEVYDRDIAQTISFSDGYITIPIDDEKYFIGEDPVYALLFESDYFRLLRSDTEEYYYEERKIKRYKETSSRVSKRERLVGIDEYGELIHGDLQRGVCLVFKKAIYRNRTTIPIPDEFGMVVEADEFNLLTEKGFLVDKDSLKQDESKRLVHMNHNIEIDFELKGFTEKIVDFGIKTEKRRLIDTTLYFNNPNEELLQYEDQALEAIPKELLQAYLEELALKEKK